MRKKTWLVYKLARPDMYRLTRPAPPLVSSTFVWLSILFFIGCVQSDSLLIKHTTSFPLSLDAILRVIGVKGKKKQKYELAIKRTLEIIDNVIYKTVLFKETHFLFSLDASYFYNRPPPPSLIFGGMRGKQGSSGKVGIGKREYCCI